MWETFLIHAFMGILSTVVKNPQKKAELKTILLEVRNSINEIYPGD